MTDAPPPQFNTGQSHALASVDRAVDLVDLVRSRPSLDDLDVTVFIPAAPRSRFWFGRGACDCRLIDSDRVSLEWRSTRRWGLLILTLLSTPVVIMAAPVVITMSQAIRRNNPWDALMIAAVSVIALGFLIYNARAAVSMVLRPPTAGISKSEDGATVEGSKDAGPWPNVRREEFNAPLYGMAVLPYSRPYMTSIPFVTSDSGSFLAVLVCDFGFCFPIACWNSKPKCLASAENLREQLTTMLGHELPLVDLERVARIEADGPFPTR